jgi:hypothetical protein
VAAGRTARGGGEAFLVFRKCCAAREGRASDPFASRGLGGLLAGRIPTFNKAVPGHDATKDNLVHSVGRRVYKDNHPSCQDVNPRGSNGWLSE